MDRSPLCLAVNGYDAFYSIVANILLRGHTWRSGTRCDCKTDWLWDRYPLDEMKYLLKFIFPFLRSGVEVKRGWLAEAGFYCLVATLESFNQFLGIYQNEIILIAQLQQFRI